MPPGSPRCEARAETAHRRRPLRTATLYLTPLSRMYSLATLVPRQPERDVQASHIEVGDGVEGGSIHAVEHHAHFISSRDVAAVQRPCHVNIDHLIRDHRLGSRGDGITVQGARLAGRAAIR